jgi:hypothetical protein
VFTLILRVKVKLFTFNFWGGAKLFTVGCGEWFLRLPAPPMNNFGGTIRKQRAQSFFLRSLRALLFKSPSCLSILLFRICVNLRPSAGNSGFVSLRFLRFVLSQFPSAFIRVHPWFNSFGCGFAALCSLRLAATKNELTAKTA